MTLTDEQIEQLNEIEQLCFHGSWTKEMLLEEINNPLSVFAYAERSGRITGFILGRIVAGEAELYQIGVHPDFRRNGVGAYLMDYFHMTLKLKDAVCCFLEVRSKNAAAITLYERFGYEKISVRKGYYGDDDAVIYRIGLEQT